MSGLRGRKVGRVGGVDWRFGLTVKTAADHARVGEWQPQPAEEETGRGKAGKALRC